MGARWQDRLARSKGERPEGDFRPRIGLVGILSGANPGDAGTSEGGADLLQSVFEFSHCRLNDAAGLPMGQAACERSRICGAICRDSRAPAWGPSASPGHGARDASRAELRIRSSTTSKFQRVKGLEAANSRAFESSNR